MVARIKTELQIPIFSAGISGGIEENVQSVHEMDEILCEPVSPGLPESLLV